MSKMVTRCPQCQTSFKVTEEHLKIANGAVRCGSCLHVFQARQHWVNPDQPTTPPASTALQAALTGQTKAAPPAETPKATGKFVFDQSAIDNSSAEQLLETPDERIPETTLTRAHQKKIDDIGDEDRISDDLYFDDDEPAIQPAAKPAESEFGDPDDDYSALFDEVASSGESEDFDALLNGDFNDLDNLDNFNLPGENNAPSDESWAKELLSALEKEEAPPEVDLSQVEDGRELLMDFTNPVDVDAARRDLGLDKADPFAARELTATGRQRAVSSQRADMIAHIEPAPVELLAPQYQRNTDWKSQLVWAGSACALVLLALAQHVFFHFEQLAQSESTRPALQTLCGIVRCQLPAAEDWRHIKISNLVVRQHPKTPDGLAVDAILFNPTNRELPFPKLELYFNDMEQLPIASRRFPPAEYLAGELTGKTLMPPGRPVHIAFEIVNPGDAAVNWSLQVARQAE